MPAALREACRLAASPQLRNMGTIGGNLLQATRCWYWRLAFPCYLHGGDHCHAREGRAPRARDLRERALRLRPSVRPGGGAPGARCGGGDDGAALSARRALPAADGRRPEPDDTPAGRAHPRTPRAGAGCERLPEGDGSPPVLVCARRSRGRPFLRRDEARARRRRADPLGLDSPDDLDGATPLPGNEYKLEIARALVRRALDQLP